MLLSELFLRCLRIPYTHLSGGLDYAVCQTPSGVELYLEASDGCSDWQRNLDFPAVAYCRAGQPVFYAHRGFLQAHRALIPILDDLLADKRLHELRIVGYSHGAALALLAYEYVGYCRPDIVLAGVGFGCPRVLFGVRRRGMQARLSGFLRVKNLDDIVTHLPPAVLGYYHVGRLLELGERGRYSRSDAHRPENILRELYAAGV